VAVSAALSASSGGIVVAGNVAIAFSPSALAGLLPQGGGQPAVLAVNVQPQPSTVGIPGGAAQFSPNGTLLDITVTDLSTGQPVTTFAAPVELTLRYNAADVGQANGNVASLTAAYVIDSGSPDVENPLGFPDGTFVVVAPENAALDAVQGIITVRTQAIGSVFTVITSPIGYVQTLIDGVSEFSSFDPTSSQTFGARPQFSTLEVVEPQIGERLLILDPDTHDYAYVEAADVAPAGPPAAVAAGATLRNLLAGP